MPQGIVPLSSLNLDADTDVAPRRRDSVRLRLSTWLHRGSLDEQIARGVATDSDERLRLRAEQLSSRAERARLANAVERILDSHDALGARGFTPRAPLQVREIRECAADIDALVRRLRNGEPIDAQGAALTKRLLTDGAGPLYYDRSRETLRYAVRSARLALEPVSRPVEAPLAA